nr:MAG TPA: hypothetical protein [Caudoviricetes sp.]
MPHLRTAFLLISEYFQEKHHRPGNPHADTVSFHPKIQSYLSSPRIKRLGTTLLSELCRIKSVSLELQNLNRLRQNQLAIDTPLGHIANHAVACEQLVELFEGTGAAVTDVVIAVITECNGILRRIRRGMNSVTQHLIRLTSLIGRLPDVGTVVVLQLAELGQRLIVHDKTCVLTIRTLEGIYQVEHIVRLDGSGKRTCYRTAASRSEKTGRLARTVTVEERILLGIGKRLAKLGDDIILQAERIVVEKFLGHLDCNVELMGIQKDLTEGGISKGECTAFLDPCRRRLGCCDIDLMLTGSCDGVSKTSHDIFFGKNINQTTVIFLRYKVAAVSVHTFKQDIGNLLEGAAECFQHTLAVFIGRTTRLRLFLSVCSHRFCHNRGIHRLIQLIFQCFHLLRALNLGTVILDFLFHVGIGSGILRRKQTVLVTLALHKRFYTLPCLVACFTKFIDRHNKLPPVFN